MPRKANVLTATGANIDTSELAPHFRKSKFDASAPAFVNVLFQRGAHHHTDFGSSLDIRDAILGRSKKNDRFFATGKEV